jgi:hypothetical protein
VHILFIDESGYPPLHVEKAKSKPFFVLGGIIIPEHFWHRIAADLKDVKYRFGVEGELKWRFFAPRNNDTNNSLSHLSQEQK